jgi:hypothetical protein
LRKVMAMTCASSWAGMTTDSFTPADRPPTPATAS